MLIISMGPMNSMWAPRPSFAPMGLILAHLGAHTGPIVGAEKLIKA